MNTTPKRHKWVRRLRPDDSVVTAAKVTLESRLRTAEHFLRLAAIQFEGTPEHVHQLRVSTRRSIAALRMYDSVLPRKRAKWFRKRLRRIRKAAGEARDLDVFLQGFVKDQRRRKVRRLKVDMREQRRRAQRPIAKLYRQLIASGKYERQLRKLLKRISCDSPTCKMPLDEWAKARLGEVAKRFFKAMPKTPEPTLKELHRFRVAGKELRYTLEIFSAVLPPEPLVTIYPLVTQLQANLGNLCDQGSTCRRLGDWRKTCGTGRKNNHLQKLRVTEQRKLERSIERFGRWWTPELADRLRESLHHATQTQSGRT